MSHKALAVVHFFAREGFARQVQNVCSDMLRNRSGDPLLVFWRAYGMLMEGESAQVRNIKSQGPQNNLQKLPWLRVVPSHGNQSRC